MVLSSNKNLRTLLMESTLGETQSPEQLNEIGEANSTGFPFKLRKRGDDYMGVFEATQPGKEPIRYYVELIDLPLYDEDLGIALAALTDDLEEREMLVDRFGNSAPGETQLYEIVFSTNEEEGLGMTGRNQVFQVMSSVVAVVKKALSMEPKRELLVLRFSGAYKTGEEMGEVTQRTQLYRKYVEKQMPGEWQMIDDDNVVWMFKIDLG